MRTDMSTAAQQGHYEPVYDGGTGAVSWEDTAQQVVTSKKEARRMKPVWMCGVASAAMLSLAALAQPAWGGSTKCTMKYSLAGWSAGYSTASGSGTITCDNGQSARVSLRAKGGGLTAGKSKTVNGSGTFSEVGDINELFGSYASAGVHAGAGESAAAKVMTKGTVSLAFSGTGKGIDLGVTFGEFVIKKQSAKKTRK
jgi:hypothetical protein